MGFTVEDSPANIVKVFPKSSDIFKEYQIDFCCGGKRPLKETFAEKEMDEEVILHKLNTAYEQWSKEDHEVIDWDSENLSQIVDHIRFTYHSPLMEELPALGQFVTRVYQRHGGTQPHLKDLYHLYNQFKMEMEEHTIKEENDVFPLIKQYEEQPSDELLQQIRIANGDLEADHDAVGDLLKQMRDVTNGFQPPETACNTYRLTYARLAELEEDTFQHIHLENNILFTRL